MVAQIPANPERTTLYISGCGKADECRRFFFHYQIDRRSKSADDKSRGGKSIWGTIAGAAKTFGFSYDYLMWGISWQNLNLMMADLPWYDYDKKDEATEVKSGDLERDLFAKYAKR